MTITLRQESQTGATTKGSSLTFAEMDNTVIDLLTNKIQAIQVDADSTNASVGLAQGTGVLEIKGGTNITTAIAADSAGTATLTITGTTFFSKFNRRFQSTTFCKFGHEWSKNSDHIKRKSCFGTIRFRCCRNSR